MKQKQFTFSRSWCIICCTVLLMGITGSCEKGDTGEEGPQGIQGERGTAGGKGDKDDRDVTGPQGVPGTANAVSSGWIDYHINSSPNTSTLRMMAYIFPANVLSLICATDIVAFLSNGGILILYGKNYGITQRKMLPYNHSHFDYIWMSNAGDIDWGGISYAQAKQMLGLKD